MVITKELRTNRREELIDITGMVADEVAKQNINEGRILIFIPHTTAAVTINENADPSVKRDIIHGLGSIGIDSQYYTHSEGNSPAHIKSSIFGCSIDVVVNNGRLLLGTWQGIYFCEFDGPRNRKFIIQILKA